MSETFHDLKQEADARAKEGRFVEALEGYRIILSNIPMDFELRLEIGDILEAMGYRDLAVSVFKAVAEHDTKSGNPLRAMAAIKRIVELGGDAKSSLAVLVAMYSADSGMTGKGLKPAPVDYTAAIPKKSKISSEVEREDLISIMAKAASDLSGNCEYPAVVPPVALFSTLPGNAFLELFNKLKLKKFGSGDRVIYQGDIGVAVYFVARGEVEVVRVEEDLAAERKTVSLAHLGPGSLFGEMALVSTDPRSASVVCETKVDALELVQSDIEELSKKIDVIAQAMTRFTRERMISNLFATNPVFKHFDPESQKKLLTRFTGHEVPKGTIFLEQGRAGSGLYIILRGKAEVLRWEGQQYTKVAELGPGDISGEISLLYEEPISATVRTITPSTLLFLARELFTPIVEAIPELLVYFNKLAAKRTEDTEFKLMHLKVADRDFVDELKESDNISEDDLVFI